jgi:serine/threonine protein kinase
MIYLRTSLGDNHPFVIGDILGKSNNKVKLAKDLITGEEVALKVLTYANVGACEEKNIREEQREMRALYDFSRMRGMAQRQTVDGKLKKYYAQTLFKGNNLEKYLHLQAETTAKSNDKELLKSQFAKMVEIFYLFCQEVQSFHDLGYLHRDIKPANMIINDEFGQLQLTLIDFGGLVQENEIADDPDDSYGTSAFRAPELPTMKHSRASDAYSTGKSLEKMLEHLVMGRFPVVQQLKDKEGRKNYKKIYTDLVDIKKRLTHQDPALRMTIMQAIMTIDELVKQFPNELPGWGPIKSKYKA